MKGDGTQASPYEVTTVAEFYEAVADHKSESPYVKLMNDIDFNDYNYWNLKSTEINFTEFDGQNHVIKNIFFKDIDRLFYISTTYNISRTLKNTIFEVIKFDSTDYSCFIDFNPFKVENFIVNCEFRAKMFSYKSSARPLIMIYNNWRVLNCVFNIDYYDGGYANIGIIQAYSVNNTANVNPYIDNCEVNINLYIYKDTGGTSASAIKIFNGDTNSTFYAGIFRNIALFINTYCSSQTLKRPIYIFNGGIVSNISVVLQNKGELDLYSFYYIFNSSLEGVNIYDKDILGSTTLAQSNSNLKALTTEQMKDPEYLKSIGFPII